MRYVIEKKGARVKMRYVIDQRGLRYIPNAALPKWLNGDLIFPDLDSGYSNQMYMAEKHQNLVFKSQKIFPTPMKSLITF